MTIENGNIQVTNENFRSPFSTFEIRLTSVSKIEPYNLIGFKPTMKIIRKQLHEIPQIGHGLHVGMFMKVIYNKRKHVVI